MRIMVQPMPEMKPPMTGAEMNLTNLPALRKANRKSHPATTSVIAGITFTASAEPKVIPRE